MTDQIKDILQELQNATASLSILSDLFQDKLDYFNEKDRRQINEFNVIFEQKRESINSKIDAFVRFIDKSFVPSPEEVARENALHKLRNDFPDFDKWDSSVQDALLNREMNNFIERTKNATKAITKHSTIGSTVAIYNPELGKAITYDVTCCRPYAIEIMGNRYDISTWRNALCRVAEVVYTIETRPLEAYMETDFSPKPLFSLRSDIYREPLEIAKGIYTEAYLSAKSLLSSCRALLDIYGIDYSEVKIFLHKIATK